MNLEKVLTLAVVPSELHTEALACFERARRDHPSHLRKHYIRLFKAGKIADLLHWEAERLIDVRPDLADWDIALARNVSCNGDNPPWDENGPISGAWLDKDPESADYQLAVQRNYWLPGTHPRSRDARKAWYRRNACELQAWRKGMPIDPKLAAQVVPVREWSADGVTVLNCGDVWQAKGTLPILGPIRWRFDIGYEIANVFARIDGRWIQSWHPLPDFELRACVVWVVYPTIFKG